LEGFEAYLIAFHHIKGLVQPFFFLLLVNCKN
jgi:hypothetical protein